MVKGLLTMNSRENGFVDGVHKKGPPNNSAAPAVSDSDKAVLGDFSAACRFRD